MPPKPPNRIPRPPQAPRPQLQRSPRQPNPSQPQRPGPTKPQQLDPSKQQQLGPPKPSATPNSPSANRRPPPLNARTLRAGASIALTSFAAAIFFRDYFLTIDTVNGSSMSPTLSPYAHETGVKDKIFIQRGSWGRDDIKRGDVITFWKPHKRDEISIKRVVAIEGDTVYPHRGYACDPDVVNGRRVEGWDGLGSREWALGGDGDVEVGKVVVPYGHVWVEGDNWRRSYDSCDLGPVSMALIDGRARWVWRDWFRLQPVGDRREKGTSRSVVIPGGGSVESRLDAVFNG